MHLIPYNNPKYAEKFFIVEIMETFPMAVIEKRVVNCTLFRKLVVWDVCEVMAS